MRKMAAATPSSRSSTSVFLGRNSRPENTHVLQVWWVDHDYINTLDMEMVMGRDFSREHASDSSSVILNEAARKVFNLENPLG